jgi:two-component sensor histidine kinase
VVGNVLRQGAELTQVLFADRGQPANGERVPLGAEVGQTLAARLAGGLVADERVERMLCVPVPVRVEADAVGFDAAAAQKLGIVANELITNAFQHGRSPITVRLAGGARLRLSVEDGGNGIAPRASGLGLELIRRMVEQGLGGSFELAALPGGGTRAEVDFPGSP